MRRSIHAVAAISCCQTQGPSIVIAVGQPDESFNAYHIIIPSINLYSSRRWLGYNVDVETHVEPLLANEYRRSVSCLGLVHTSYMDSRKLSCYGDTWDQAKHFTITPSSSYPLLTPAPLRPPSLEEYDTCPAMYLPREKIHLQSSRYLSI